MNKSTNGWIEVAKTFASNCNAEILCPECNKTHLSCQSIDLSSAETAEYRIFCSSCGVENFMRLKNRENKLRKD